MPVLDRSALEDTPGMDFLAAALGAPRPEPARPTGVSKIVAGSPDRLDSGRRIGAAGKLACSGRRSRVPSLIPAGPRGSS